MIFFFYMEIPCLFLLFIVMTLLTIKRLKSAVYHTTELHKPCLLSVSLLTCKWTFPFQLPSAAADLRSCIGSDRLQVRSRCHGKHSSRRGRSLAPESIQCLVVSLGWTPFRLFWKGVWFSWVKVTLIIRRLNTCMVSMRVMSMTGRLRWRKERLK